MEMGFDFKQNSIRAHLLADLLFCIPRPKIIYTKAMILRVGA